VYGEDVSDAPLPPPATRDAPFVDGWRIVAIVSWVLVFLSLVAVAVSGRTIGRSPWWLGPEADPAPVWMMAVPVSLVIVPVWWAVRRTVTAGLAGAVCALLLGLVAIPDAADRPGIAVAVAVIAAAALASSVAVVAGTRHYR
jgi:hypothetical protein